MYWYTNSWEIIEESQFLYITILFILAQYIGEKKKNGHMAVK